MIEFERTADFELVRSILTRPAVWERVIDDSTTAAEEFRPNGHPAIWYVLAKSEGRILGLYTFIPQNAVCFEIHTSFAFGALAAEAGRGIFDWMWKHSPARRIVASPPAFNRLVIRYAERSGMTKFGVNEKSFLRFGRLHDQILLGISPT